MIQQLAAPAEMYANPSSLFVATFVGTMNVLQGISDASRGPPRRAFPPAPARRLFPAPRVVRFPSQ